MRILFITRGFPPKGLWGSEGYAEGLARGFAARGHECDVFFPVAGPAGLEVSEVAKGLRTIEFSAPPRRGKPFVDSYRDPRQDHALHAWLERTGAYDRVHFTTLAGGVSTGLIGVVRPRTRELLVTITDLLPLCHRGQLLDAELRRCTGPAPEKCSACVLAPGPYADPSLWRGVRSRVVRGLGRLAGASLLPTTKAFAARERYIEERFAEVDHFIIASEAARQEYVSRGMDPARITAIPYALDPERYRAVLPIASKDGRLRLGMIAQLAPHKGVDVVVEAMARLAPELRERCMLLLYGKPTSTHHPRYGHELLQRIGASGLPIELRGAFAPDRIAEVMAEFDVVLVPSVWLESLPLVVLHTRGMGLPLLGSDVGGVGPFVEDGQDGLVLAAGDAEAWSEGLRRVLEDSELLARLQRGARARGVPMDYAEHLDVLSSLESIRAFAAR